MTEVDTGVRAFWEGLRPDPLLTVAEWAEKYRFLPSEGASEHGRWRNSRTPYLVEIMECLSVTSPVEEVVFMKGAQLGGTEIGNNFLAYVMDLGLGPTLAVSKTESLAERFSKQRLRPMIRDTPRLREKVSHPSKRDGSNTLLHLSFAGGQLMLANAEAAGGLRSMPIRNLFGDEVDSYPLDVEGEGDPCDLAEARTRTFSLRKILWVSTPTDEATSRIARKFKEGDQRYYQVPCPHCGHFQKLTWQGIQFDRSDDGELIPESIGYACAECGTLIEERHKRTMLRDGKWVPERPRLSRKVRSYHLSSLYSPLGWLKWEDIIRANLKAGKDPYSRKVWVNTMLGETWKERGEVPDWEALYNRRELYGRGTVPSGVVFLTMGVDVQANRMEYEIVGWGPRRESWSVDYGVIPCDPAQDDWHDPLDELRMREWPCEDGTHVRIRMVGVDSGYMAPHIYTYCRTRPDTISLKGDQRLEQAAGPLRLVDINHKGRRVRRGAKLRAVGTDFCKAELYSFLRQNQPAKGEMPAGWCHFPQYDEEYFKMLTGEQLVVKKDTRGYSKRVWEKTRERNEALDCRVYARACAAIVGMDRWTEERWKQEAERVGLGAVKRKRPTRPAGQRRTLHGGNSWLG